MTPRSGSSRTVEAKPAGKRASSNGIVVDTRGATRVRNGHPWIYRSDVLSAEGIAPGAIVGVSDPHGKFLGSALYSTASQIAVRMLATRRLESADEVASLLQERIAAAIEYRRRVVTDSDAYRVIFSEADLLPGLIVDRYNDVLSVQMLTQALDAAVIRDLVVHELAQSFAPEGIVERVEERIRDLEQMPPRAPALLHGEKTDTVFTMNRVKFQYDALAGQKTGAFLDQRENYRAAADHARGEALDVFCYQGGFALHLARNCEHVSAVDSSRAALEIAEQNAALNQCDIEWIEANAFDLLKDYATAGRQYDTIVLDPPAFAKTRRAVPTAIRGYKELNLRALKMLRPGGLLVTCSCSYHVSEPEFLEMLASAALDAHRPLKILERRTQSKDHPVLLTVPETQYLKCVLAVVGSTN